MRRWGRRNVRGGPSALGPSGPGVRCGIEHWVSISVDYAASVAEWGDESN